MSLLPAMGAMQHTGAHDECHDRLPCHENLPRMPGQVKPCNAPVSPSPAMNAMSASLTVPLLGGGPE